MNIEKVIESAVKNSDSDEKKLETYGAYKEYNKTPMTHYNELSKMRRPLLVELHRRMGFKFSYQYKKEKLIDDLINFHRHFCDQKYLMQYGE